MIIGILMKDMKNTFLLFDYWQQATDRDVDSFMSLLLRTYFKKNFLPREAPCTMRYGIYPKNPFTEETFDTPKEYFKKAVFDKTKKTVVLAFYGHNYPNDFMPVVRAFCERLSQSLNVLPLAFSQNDDADQADLERMLKDEAYPVSAMINLMSFRLGAGPMGGDADGAVKILEGSTGEIIKKLRQIRLKFL